VTQRGSAGTSSINQEGQIDTGGAASFIRLSVPAGASCSAHLELFQEQTQVAVMDRACEAAGG
jgi:hypothetical protein